MKSGIEDKQGFEEECRWIAMKELLLDKCSWEVANLHTGGTRGNGFRKLMIVLFHVISFSCCFWSIFFRPIWFLFRSNLRLLFFLCAFWWSMLSYICFWSKIRGTWKQWILKGVVLIISKVTIWSGRNVKLLAIVMSYFELDGQQSHFVTFRVWWCQAFQWLWICYVSLLWFSSSWIRRLFTKYASWFN